MYPVSTFFILNETFYILYAHLALYRIPQTLEAVTWPRFQDEAQFMDLSVESYRPKKGMKADDKA